MSGGITALQGAMTKLSLTHQSLRLIPQIPDGITLTVLDNASAMELLVLRQVSRGLRRTVDSESSRLCRRLRDNENARIEAMGRPLDLKDMSMEQALRLRVQRWGKPLQRNYLRVCVSLAGSYSAANPHESRHRFQENLFEFLLHLDDSIHVASLEMFEDGSKRIAEGCCWLKHRAVECSQGKLTMKKASELLHELRGLSDHVAPPIEVDTFLTMIASVRSHPLQHDDMSYSEKMWLHMQFRDMVLHAGEFFSPRPGYYTELQLPPLWSPLCWIPKIDRPSAGGALVKNAKAVSIARWLLHRAQTRCCCSKCDEHARLVGVALLQELDVFPLEGNARHMMVLDGISYSGHHRR